MTSGYLEVDRYMGALLSQLGFELETVDSDIVYGKRSAWAVFYSSQDCKIQVCWSAREGGIDFMLALPDAPNEFGLLNRSKKWHFLLMLSGFDDGLVRPRLGASTDVWWEWRRALFEAHFPVARDALRQEG